MNQISELEKVILDQIEKLNQDDVCATEDESRQLIERSKAISDLTNAFMKIQDTKLDEQRLKIEAVKVVSDKAFGLKFENYLGIEDKKDKENG